MIQKLLCLFLLFCPLLFAAKYPGLPIEVKANTALEKHCLELCKIHQLKFLNIALGHICDAPNAIWGISLTSGRHLKIDEARPIAKSMTQDLLHFINNSPPISVVYELYSKSSPPPPMSNDLLCYKIVFWDENVDRPQPPYIAQIRYANDNLYYYYANAAQVLSEPIVEPINQP